MAERLFSKRNIFAYALICGFVFLTQVFLEERQPPVADALRYLDYAFNLNEHGVFGLSPPPGEAFSPGRANAPLYPWTLSLFLRLSDVAQGDVACHVQRQGQCAYVFQGVALWQTVLMCVGLCALWAAGNLIFGRLGAGLTVLASYLSGEFTDFPNELLTENLTIPLVCVLTLAIVAFRTSTRTWAAALGVTSALLVLTRPEFIYLTWALIATFCGRLFMLRTRRTAVELALVLLCTVVLIGPWAVRNYVYFGDPALTQTYGGKVLAERISYNDMSLGEVAVAFVHWFPDFGDSITERLLPSRFYERLGFDPNSYSAVGVQRYYDDYLHRWDPEQMVGALIKTEILGNPIKHGIVSAALMWRGAFVATLWGALGLFSAGYMMFTGPPRLRTNLWRIALAPSLMMVLYATVSVSIPRYGVCLIPLYSLAMAGVALAILARLRPAPVESAAP
ncbi:MAG: hypothetical protein AAF384_15835 [Pseudomonadota bacterium]